MSIDTLNARLPHINVSYGRVLDKPCPADMYQVVPKGSRSLLWYTYCKGMNVCYLLYLGQNNKSIYKIEKVITSFHTELCYGQGTLLSGVCLHFKDIHIFTIMDIHIFKGWSISEKTFIDKFKYITCVLANHTRPHCYVTCQWIVASAIVLPSYEEALEVSSGLPYKVDCITLIDEMDTTVKGKYVYSPKDNPVRFRILSASSCDIYSLHTDASDTVYAIAYIPDYKTSVMMNSLFRNIKENNNLDLIEESDEEAEESSKYLNISIVMECVYDRTFK